MNSQEGGAGNSGENGCANGHHGGNGDGNNIYDKSLPGLKDFKCVFLGDGTVGKTSMLHRFKDDRFDPVFYQATIFDNYAHKFPISKTREGRLQLWDTGGQEDYKHFRELSLPHTNVFVICFALNSFDSFDNALHKWYRGDLKKYLRETPQPSVLLVGTKKDLRDPTNGESRECDDNGNKFLTTVQGQELADNIGAYKYIECSSLTGENVQEVFRVLMEVCIKIHDDRGGSKNSARRGQCSVDGCSVM